MGNLPFFVKTESSKNIEVSFETIADLLSDHYPSSEMDLKQQKDDVNRKSRPIYQNAKKIQDSVIHNTNIVTLDQEIESHLDPPDYETAITLKANKLS
jgi:hypothetical protein